MALPLLPASFRSVPFATTNTAFVGGRRIALHVYPGKDEPWAEDLGRAPRVYRVRGFLVEGDLTYLGGPVIMQRLTLLAALEKSGPGLLTHPTIGALNVAVRGFSISEELDAKRRSAIEIEFVESGKQSFPSILTSSGGLLTAANVCTAALALDGVRLIAAAAGAGETRDRVSSVTSSYSGQAVSLGADATALHRLAAQLPGPYGRYSAGGNAGFSGTMTTVYTSATTVDDLIAVASAARTAIAESSDTLSDDVETTDLTNATNLAADISALVQALADACADPADAIRLLEDLISYAPSAAIVGSASGAAVAGMFQRAAASSLITAVGAYQPTSSDDAASLLFSISALLDDLATAAADAGDDESFQALRVARVAVVKDLRERGASLAQVTTFTFGQPLPALVLAQRLYRDPSRADQLVTQVPETPSPLFMPTSLDALAA